MSANFGMVAIFAENSVYEKVETYVGYEMAG